MSAINEVVTQWFEYHYGAFESDGTITVTEDQLEELENMLGGIAAKVKLSKSELIGKTEGLE